MAARGKKRLGRGLDALLSGANLEGGEELRSLGIDLIKPGRYQPRTGMNRARLEELAESLRAQGMVQPIVVRSVPGGDYEIIAGERRWRAAQIAGLHEVPALVREVPDQAAMAIALIENIQREDLSALEEAGALKRLVEEFELTHTQVAETVSRSRTAVTNLLRLLELEPDTRVLLEKGRLEMGHARALLSLSGADQVRAARRVADQALTVREAEELVRGGGKASGKSRKTRRADPDVRRLEETLQDRLGAVVKIQHKGSGRGRLVIHYTSLDELDGILRRIK